jgi:translation elongation factor EF-Tu-like GTPase
MDKVLHFTNGEWFNISGRGWVYATEMPEDYDESLLNKSVLIDHQPYTITGVEMFAIANNKLYVGRRVGLLVKGNRKDLDIK